MCGARCLIGRGEASKGARRPRGRGVQGGEMSIALGRDVWFPMYMYPYIKLT